MKNYIKAISILLLLIGCAKNKTIPIEKYSGSKYVVTEMQGVGWSRLYNIQLKNKDTIFWITVLSFDTKNLKVGDTIK